jgi:hypothetical protein
MCVSTSNGGGRDIVTRLKNNVHGNIPRHRNGSSTLEKPSITSLSLSLTRYYKEISPFFVLSCPRTVPSVIAIQPGERQLFHDNPHVSSFASPESHLFLLVEKYLI